MPRSESRRDAKKVRSQTGPLSWQLTFPSAAKATSYAPSLVAFLYFALSCWILSRKLRGVLEVLAAKVTSRQWQALNLLFWGGLVTAFVVLFPIANSGSVGGGSDRDEALNIGATELLHGRNPYHARTYVPGLPHAKGLDGNVINPLPGSLLLSLPFVLLGTSAYQSFFWLAVLAAYWRRAYGRMWSLCGILLLVMVSPIGLHEIVTGGDLLANSIWILLGYVAFVRAASRTSIWACVGAALFLGLGLSSRAHFALGFPIVFSEAVRLGGLRRALWMLLLAALAFTVVTLPYYLWDPASFAPFHNTRWKLEQFRGLLPHAGLVIPFIAFVLSCVLGIKNVRRGLVRPWLASGWVICIPVYAGVLLATLSAGRLTLMPLGFYALSGSVFAIHQLLEHLQPRLDEASNVGVFSEPETTKPKPLMTQQ